MASVLRIRIRSKLSHIEIIPTASPSLAFVLWKFVNPSPNLCRPLLRILPNRSEPLIASLEQEFTQCVFHPEIRLSQSIWLRSSISSFNSDFIFGTASDTFFNEIGTCSLSSPFRPSDILLHDLKLSIMLGFFPPEFHPLITMESQQTNCW